ncbi:MAG: DUF692 domain-containing protein [Chlamydiota bacterium]
MITGVGLGFRREFAEALIHLENDPPAFIELAPENWMDLGGFFKKQFSAAIAKYPVICHGLSLSLGSPEPLDWQFLKNLKRFLKEVPVQLYSEHLSYSKCDNAHFYDLLPLPFTEDAVRHVTERIIQVQDFLERPIAIENVSYYTPVTPEMSESEFLTRIVQGSGCQLLLDVNNVYVNSFNHGYDAHAFLKQIPLDKTAYIHMAGHEKVSDDLIIDTHGHPIIAPVYDLFHWVIERISPVPILLERDFNCDDFPSVHAEVRKLQGIVDSVWSPRHALC